jgi:hypothetical protein
VVASIPDLIKIDGGETAALVLQEFSEEHENVLEKLAPFPELQYQYLKGFLTPNSKRPDWRHHQDTPELQERYLELMCRLEPAAVYRHLQTTEK